MVREMESLDDLNLKGYKIIQPESGFKFGIDAVLIANFVRPRQNEVGVDLGSGSGIIPVIIAAKSKAAKIIGVEIQKEAWDASVRTAALNGLEGRIEFLHHDIKSIAEILPGHSYDFVISNPPYYKVDTLASPNNQKNIARHEMLINHKEILEAAAYLLKQKKPFYMINKPERLVELIEDGRKLGLEPKEIQFVHPNASKPPNLVLLKYVKGGKAGLKYHPPLFVYDKNGGYTQQIKYIYENDCIGE